MDELNRLIHELREELGMSNEQKVRVRIAVAVSREGHVGVSYGSKGREKPTAWSDKELINQAVADCDGDAFKVSLVSFDVDVSVVEVVPTIETVTT